jgi:diphthine-ammonia ligase
MDFVALISGGKDSCFNIWKCIQYGHKLKCLANLQSPMDDQENEEVNSFMYQSTGSSVIPAYADCLGVPLIRRTIEGKAVSQSLSYESQVEGDEVEDLFLLLKEVIQRFPTIKGVSCGAIVSNYQRTRVENICQRLGLTCLSYLWQRDRKELFHEIVHEKIDAILVKVAGAGLEPDKHLGKTLANLLPVIDRLHNKYGLDYCGEGGEYESLVLDTPIFLKKIEILEKLIIYDEEDPSVGMLKIVKWRVVEKNPLPTSVPAIEYNPLKEIIQTSRENIRITQKSISQINLSLIQCVPNLAMGLNGFGQTDFLFPPPTTYHSDTTPEVIQRQVTELLQKLKNILTFHQISLFDCIFIHLYISHMSLFAEVNNEYCKWFQANPPSRCCVEVSLFRSL